jgi:hypothetical protein
MLLGQLVAVSVASNLFYLALILSGPPLARSHTRIRTIPPLTWICVHLSLVNVALTPYTSEQTFLPNLLAMHVLLILPLIPSPTHSSTSLTAPTRFSVSLRKFYYALTLFGIALRGRTTFVALSSISHLGEKEMWSALWETLHSHPAQSSIGWDAVWVTIGFLVWSIQGTRESWFGSGLGLALASAFASVGVTASYTLGKEVAAQETAEVEARREGLHRD